jgi:hypothetical protein
MYTQPFTGQGVSSSGAQSLVVRNLELLRAIEDTVDGLVADTDLVTSISRTYSELKSQLLPNTTEIDPSGRICAVLDKASNSCVRIFNDANNRHVSARLDPQVRPDDGLVEAYNEFVSAVSELHDTIVELSDWISSHDAVLQPTTGQTFETVDTLFDALLSKN